MNAREQKINELVAKHIFGKRRMAKDGHAIWVSPGEKLTFGIKSYSSDLPTEYVVKTPEEAGFVESDEPHEMDRYSVLDYCSDPSYVGMIVEAMAKKRGTVTIDTDEGRWYVDMAYTSNLSESFSSLPMALCIVSLKSLGVEVPSETT